MAQQHRTKNPRSQLLNHSHPQSNGATTFTWELKLRGDVVVADNMRRNKDISAAKFTQVLEGFRALVHKSAKGFRWEIACPFDPREMAARSPSYFHTRRKALLALVEAALAVEEVA